MSDAAASSRGAVLRAEGLAVGRATTLLQDVDLALEPAQCWFVLGPNGAGKSTLLATLLGLLRPRGGRVAFGASVPSRRQLGYVPQQDGSALTLPVTVAEFVALGLCDLGLARHAMRARVETALAAMGMAPNAHRRVAELSLGQRRRALVARALAREPKLLVLDEPTANLDPETAEQLAADLERTRREAGTCIVHASHDLRLAERFATHFAVVKDGRVTCRVNDAAAARRDGMHA